MQICFDPVKDDRNQARHGVSMSLAAELDWDSALIWPDQRRDYGEQRQCALALLGGRLFFVAFTDRHNEGRRIISLRKANNRELRRYVENHED